VRRRPRPRPPAARLATSRTWSRSG
jgi:hypothetical protein